MNIYNDRNQSDSTDLACNYSSDVKKVFFEFILFIILSDGYLKKDFFGSYHKESEDKNG